MPDTYLVSTLIRGVWLDALRIYLREKNLANIAITCTLARTWKEARVNIDYAQYEDLDLYSMVTNNYDVIAKLDSYNRNLYPKMSNNLLRIEGPQSFPIMNPKPLAIRDPQDPLMDSISIVEKNSLN